MLLCSGRTYHHDHLDIDAKLDLIIKELENLKFRVKGLENKNKESFGDDNRDKRAPMT